MGGDRKHVAVYSRNDSFTKAVRLLLSEADVSIIGHENGPPRPSDLIIWHCTNRLPADRVAEIATETPVLVLAPPDELTRAVEAGCIGFLSDEAPLEQISQAIDTVLSGGAVVQPDLLGVLLKHLVERGRRSRGRTELLDQLTPRERQVFELAAEGLRKDEIGERLFISPDTARTHLQRVYRKLGVHSQAELMAFAIPSPNEDEEDH